MGLVEKVGEGGRGLGEEMGKESGWVDGRGVKRVSLRRQRARKEERRSVRMRSRNGISSQVELDFPSDLQE